MFYKPISEINRNKKLKRRNFCSRSCVAKQCNSEKEIKIPSEFKEKWNGSNSDECTPFRYYLKKARARKWDYDIDCSYLNDLWKKQKGKCSISGLDMKLKTHSNTSEDLGLTAASLDRIDSSLGYIKGNVQFMCVGLNLLKGKREDSEVIDFLDKIIKSPAPPRRQVHNI